MYQDYYYGLIIIKKVWDFDPYYNQPPEQCIYRYRHRYSLVLSAKMKN